MTSLIEMLSHVPIFSDLDADTLDSIVIKGQTKSYLKDEIVLTEAEEGTALFVVLKGRVKVARCSPEGLEVVLTILDESEFFGELAILDGLTRNVVATSLHYSEVFIIHREELLGLIMDNPSVSIALIKELTERLRAAEMKVKSLSLKDTEGKVAAVLLHLADDTATIKGGMLEIDKLPTQQDLANMAGTSRETVLRTIHSFARKGLIELEGDRLIIPDYEKFKENYG